MKKFDKTRLNLDAAEEKLLIHRDYIAHCMRWTYVQRYMIQKGRYKDTALLDIGCGVEVPLYRMICTNRLSGVRYYGVDVNKLELPEKFQNRKVAVQLYGETDFLEMTPPEPVDLVTSFEMLEHVPFEHAQATLKHAYEVSKPTATLMVSTPVYDADVGAAKSHINEMTREQMITILTEAGWQIEHNYGTFASQKDYKPEMTDEDLEMFNKLSAYYDSNYLATIFAPLYPEYSRNNLWHCKKA